MTGAVFDDFVASVRADVHRYDEPAQLAEVVAGRLEQLVAAPGWLAEEYRQASAHDYRQHVLYVAPDESFSVVALVWLPHQHTPIHDHLAWCVVGVLEGEETEVRYRLCQDVTSGEQLLVREETCRARAGQVSTRVPPGDDIHQVINDGAGQAISIHVYGTNVADSGSSIRRRFDNLQVLVKEPA